MGALVLLTCWPFDWHLAPKSTTGRLKKGRSVPHTFDGDLAQACSSRPQHEQLPATTK